MFIIVFFPLSLDFPSFSSNSSKFSNFDFFPLYSILLNALLFLLYVIFLSFPFHLLLLLHVILFSSSFFSTFIRSSSFSSLFPQFSSFNSSSLCPDITMSRFCCWCCFSLESVERLGSVQQDVWRRTASENKILSSSELQGGGLPGKTLRQPEALCWSVLKKGRPNISPFITHYHWPTYVRNIMNVLLHYRTYFWHYRSKIVVRHFGIIAKIHTNFLLG